MHQVGDILQAHMPWKMFWLTVLCDRLCGSHVCYVCDLPAAKKREMEDNSKKLGQLLWRLNAGDVSAGVIPKLLQLAQAIDAGDWHSANHIQVRKQHGKHESFGSLSCLSTLCARVFGGAVSLVLEVPWQNNLLHVASYKCQFCCPPCTSWPTGPDDDHGLG
jgi:hypothetical protein